MLHQCVLVLGHDVDWAPPDATIDLAELPGGQPAALVESDDPNLYLTALQLPGGRYVACAGRKDIVLWYFDGVDPGRCSVRRDLLAALEAARNGTPAELDDALDALIASVRD